jgi:hypothetical protein
VVLAVVAQRICNQANYGGGEMTALKLGNGHVLKTAKEALQYCDDCPYQKNGCAKNCKIRRHFKIPPHGDFYPE